jgi:hypothetical protein
MKYKNKRQRQKIGKQKKRQNQNKKPNKKEWWFGHPLLPKLEAHRYVNKFFFLFIFLHECQLVFQAWTNYHEPSEGDWLCLQYSTTFHVALLHF